MRWLLVLSLSLTACGSAMQNTKTAAILGAAAAAAATAADPDYASRAEEENKVESLDGKPVAKSVPADALDRLDQIPLD
jgi:hypothetical protein